MQNAIFVFQELDLKELCIHKGENQAFISGKGQNPGPKWLSECDSFLCEQAHYFF